MIDLSLALQIGALLFGLYMAWNIGANDVANAMGTSVGSKALTLRQAVILAAILEFAGAFLVGSHVSETIQKGILHPHIFQHEPLLFVLGMLSALLATGLLLHLASYLALPISTTHAIVGAVLGFGFLVSGTEAIQWSAFASIVASWLISPLISGVLSYLFFRFIQKKILNTSLPLIAMQRWAPLFLFFSFALFGFSFLYRASFESSLFSALPAAFVLGLSGAIFAHRKIQRIAIRVPISSEPFVEKEEKVLLDKIFISLQVVSACMVAFAHGANDVANAIGPTAAIFDTLKTGALSAQSVVPSWLLALGGLGIAAGLATWGWRVIETIGKKITDLTPARGFAAELSSAVTILFASKLGLPISTTHALVGAICGVGMARGYRTLNVAMLKEISLSWIITIPLSMLLCMAIFSCLQWLPLFGYMQ